MQLCERTVEQKQKNQEKLSQIGSEIFDIKSTNNQILQEVRTVIPYDLINKEIKVELDIIRKLRFFGNFKVSSLSSFADRLLSGDLSEGSSRLRSKALAWCVRLMITKDIEKSEFLINESKRIATNDEISIAEAFLLAAKNNLDDAVKSLTQNREC